MKQQFKIGGVSRLYGIGPDSLRYYEELGILKPERDENDYRVYGLYDMWKLNVIRDLRKLGFSMRRIKEYLEHRSVETTEILLTEELQVIESELRVLKRLKKEVEERLDVVRKARRQPLDQVERRYIAGRSCHMIHSGYQRDEEMDVLIKQLVNKDQANLYIIGNNRIGSMISIEYIREQEYRRYESVFIIDDCGKDKIEEGEYLTLHYQGDGEKNDQYIPMLLQYAEDNGLTPVGPVLELLWVDIHQSADAKEHIVELQVRCTSV